MEIKNNLEEILKFNKEFVEKKEYEKYNTTKYPDKKIAILSCMDTRLTELLPKALDLKNGDAKIIKNAGGTVIHPFGSAMRSLLICVYEFDIKEIFIIGHYDCGVSSMDTDKMIKKMIEKGIDVQTLDTLSRAGIKVKKWLHGFDCVEESVRESVTKVKNHPLMPSNVAIHGLIMDPLTGRLDVAVNGFEHI
ncbi:MULTISPECIES: beta-class carbonic anhydrase [Fusobacterium]|jgi:carbonic anhydrase|uniref:Carbonic anhydrase n=1 Tax=Fusobacterium mortiferum ATCC 9817 TaxID=469616 RepID=A0ABM6TWI4_FUSMR|nr:MULTISPECIES: carbonic anhydrase [Fusobacterium]AVQ19103.1 carbonic anhydrase [Fusobacterium mortiferum ATCC 9817]EEO35358.1 carbonate dehydratase [Fusobacterium mortiferum ATCC 9817]MCF2626670.1 carbonic anhydrase [Fusobacterium mortiferum]MCF2698306.1 carbonic anhydrase [Fusobacterium mortiferum]MCI6381154.1 carbonic anhydrase [Fusobacterium mortiferum]